MPIDINRLRVDKGGDPEYWRENQRKRFKDDTIVDRVLEYDAEWRTLTTKIRDAGRDTKRKSTEIGKAIKAHGKDSEEVAALKAEVKEMQDAKKDLELKLGEVAALRDAELGKLANETHPDVPVSKSEHDNVEREAWGGKPVPELAGGAKVRPHHELLYMISGFEPERGTAIAGHRGYFLTGPGVLLNTALIRFGIDFLGSRSYTPIQPPYFMKKDAMAAVAQLDDFDEQLYRLTSTSRKKEEEAKGGGGEGGEGGEGGGDGGGEGAAGGGGKGGKGGKGEEEEDGADDKYLIATSEQPVCLFHLKESLREAEVPKRYAGWSSCFRKEAGSSGRDLKGIFRVHQFEKIEQFCVTRPGESWDMHKEMSDTAAAFYKALGIPYHVVDIVSVELNSAAARKLDLEGWFPAAGEYRELVSCSNCTDYQARAVETRFIPNKEVKGEKLYCHFLNSTLCATTRTICAILENHQTAEGIRVPEALVPYVGKDFIPFTRMPVDKDGKPIKDPALKAIIKKNLKAIKTGTTPAPTPTPTTSTTTTSTTSTPPLGSTPSLSTDAGLAALNAKLATQPYVNGFAPEAEDALVFALLQRANALKGRSAADGTAFPHVARWERHIAAFSDARRAQLRKGGPETSNLFSA